ncbi:AAA family ATPase [Roseospira marina]|uniref:AAA family ATPase n=1 Tax=Roseospira marina TaxID=140057 RepID=A0A5M6I7V9_9PROT|nr:SMC family ATPase [Roseospira marina]KAA5604364.1 AAA family ATPase [Roseospira marina]MBB4315450.1 DNA repair exonuclease SbcCD ATPase subunit [Roseospira marina]MBB5088404.1 DNA repair exonuclease SbcCD ATPase subunit [Roseospira marina]
MKFTDMVIQNFLTIGEATIGLDDVGLMLIQGVNDDDSSADSNGAGKSSIADALSWCLFGITARGVTGDGVVNRTVGKETCVQLDVKDGEDIYRIIRHRKHKTGKNAVHLLKLDGTGASTDLTKGTDKLTQAEVVRVIGCSYEVFRAAVYAAQEQMPDLPALTDKQLKLLVEEAAGITLLEQAHDTARAVLVAERAQLSEVERDLARLNDRLEIVQSNLIGAERRQEVFERERAARVLAARELAKAAAGEAKTAARAAEVYDPTELAAQLAEVDAKIAGLEGERQRERELADDAAKADRTAGIERSKLTRLVDEVRATKARLTNTEELVGTPCGECGKTYETGDLTEVRAHLGQSLHDVVARCKAQKTVADDAQTRAQMLADALEEHRASMTSVAALNAQRDALRRDIDARAARLSEVARHTEQARKYLTDAETRKTEPNPHDAEVAEQTALITALTEKINAIKTTALPAGQKKVEVAEQVVRVYGPGGVRALILDTVTPFLNERTARYLGTLTDGHAQATWSTLTRTAKGELREKFTIDVVHAAGGDSFAALSGGEKRKVRVACALALQDLVASRATKPIELFFGDEIDDALDSAGLERLMGILEEKARERGTVMVISHRSLRDWISQVLTVRKHGGLASVEWVT